MIPSGRDPEAQVSTVNAKALASSRSRLNLVRHRLDERIAELRPEEDYKFLQWVAKQIYLAHEELSRDGDPPF